MQAPWLSSPQLLHPKLQQPEVLLRERKLGRLAKRWGRPLKLQGQGLGQELGLAPEGIQRYPRG